jgi:hypothetical protein
VNETTVYLHIGTPKTGTSVLQYFLLKNRDRLHSKGVDYPTHTLDPNGVSSGNAKQIVLALESGNNSEAKHIITEYLNSSYRTILLSSEYFFRLEKHHIATLKDMLGPVNTKIIVYLRKQDSLLESLYNQGVKQGQWTLKLAPFIDSEVGHKYHSYYDRLNAWASCYSKETINVHIYEKEEFVGGRIFSDFLDAIEVTHSSEFDFPSKQVNVSFRIDALEFMRQLNFLELPPDTPAVYRLLQPYSEKAAHEKDWRYPLMSPECRHEIMESYRNTNAAIAREYLARPDGVLFNKPLPDIDEPWEPYPGLTKQQCWQIACYITKNDKETADRICQAIHKGLTSGKNTRAAAKILAPGFDLTLPKHRLIHLFLIDIKEYLKYRWHRTCHKISKKLKR